MANNGQQTPTDLIKYLNGILDEKKDQPDSKPALSLGRLREIMGQVADPEGIDIRELISEILNKYKDDYPQGDGYTAADLWKDIRKAAPETPLQEVENILTDMLQKQEIHSRRNGFTTYNIGANPEEDETKELKPG